MDSTTVGIVPRHLLESVEPSQLREADFNQSPVGTGPFKIKTFAPSAKEIELSANPKYHFGRPRLDEFNFKFYDTAEATLRAYAQHQVASPGRIRQDVVEEANRASSLKQHAFTLPEEITLFFANENPLLKGKALRGLLSRSIDREAVVDRAAGGQGIVVTQPLLPGQNGYTNKYSLAQLNKAAAKKALDEAGWVQTRPGAVRVNNGSKLNLKLTTLKGGELELVGREIKRQWADLGIGVEVVAVERDELQQTYMRPRNFEMLLYGVNIGADPDVYSFWHSSQAKDPGVNLSGYSSAESDKALEAGRIKSDPLVRQGKYDAFLKAWNDDSPAVVLYQSGYVYGTRDTVAGIAAHRLVVPSDRYYGVERWTIRRQFVPTR